MGSTLNEFFEISAFAGVTLSLLAYALGMFLKRNILGYLILCWYLSQSP